MQEEKQEVLVDDVTTEPPPLPAVSSSPSATTTTTTTTPGTTIMEPMVLLPTTPTPFITKTSSNNIIELNMMQSIIDLQVRSEVESCLQSLLVDVEMTHYLKQELQVRSCQEKVEYLELQQQATVMETKTLQLYREEQKLLLADQMVQELTSLNRELVSLIEWKQQHEHKVNTYDELVAKLLQAEDELQAANRITYGGGGGGSIPPRKKSVPPETEEKEETAAAAATATADTAEIPTDTATGEAIITDGAKIPSASDELVVSKEKEKEDKSTIISEIDIKKEEEDDVQSEMKDIKPNDAKEKTTDSEDVTSKNKDISTGNLLVTDGAAEVLVAAAAASAAAGGVVAEIGDDSTTKDPSSSAAAATAATTTTNELSLSKVKAEAKEDDEKEEDTDGGVVAAAVSLDDEDPNKEVPGLVELDIEILMHLFGFMDPMDILNTAQISIAMYNRVDALFGLAEDGVTPPSQAKEAAAAAATAAAANVAPTTTTAAAPASSSSQRQQQRQASTSVAAKNPPTVAKPTTTDSASTYGLFSMLQPARAAASAASTSVASGKPAAKSTATKSGGTTQPLNASVAQSMATKLSAAELAAIISMTEKISKMEQESNTLKNEKELLEGKLQGTEAVKQFLIGKVRDVERNLKHFKENEVKVTQQISSDQEVIGFLDARVQVLEKEVDQLRDTKTKAETELRNLKGSSGQKVTLLSDMLKYEREKLRENESEWKSTKKVLVKEVKSCRSQIVALQAERDGYREQNEMLKRAMLSSSSSNGGGGGGGGGSSPRRGGTSPTRR